MPILPKIRVDPRRGAGDRKRRRPPRIPPHALINARVGDDCSRGSRLCAQLQSSDAFWALHDELFREQREITPANVKQKLLDFARATKAIEIRGFQSCLDNQLSLGLVFRDIDLASAAGVDGTPTISVNGERLSRVADAARLREFIRAARSETAPDSFAAHQASHSMR